jgi:hypothetical protein
MTSSASLGFSYQARASGEVHVLRNGTRVTILRGREAQEFLARLAHASDAAAQQLMARLTGNYKRGNERTAAQHPRHRQP